MGLFWFPLPFHMGGRRARLRRLRYWFGTAAAEGPPAAAAPAEAAGCAGHTDPTYALASHLLPQPRLWGRTNRIECSLPLLAMLSAHGRLLRVVQIKCSDGTSMCWVCLPQPPLSRRPFARRISNLSKNGIQTDTMLGQGKSLPRRGSRAYSMRISHCVHMCGPEGCLRTIDLEDC